MITVSFFGVMSVNSKIRKIEMKEGTVRDVLAEITSLYPDITEKQLKHSMMVINKKHVSGRKRLSIHLAAGDELVFLTPSSGG